MSVRSLGRAISALSWRDRAELVTIVAVAACVELGIRVMRLPQLARVLRVPLDTSPGHGKPMTTPPPPWAVRRLELCRAVLKHWPAGDTCLRRSLVMGQRVRSLAPVLRVGVAKNGTLVTAHAWLELDGYHFDPSAASYETVASLSP